MTHQEEGQGDKDEVAKSWLTRQPNWSSDKTIHHPNSGIALLKLFSLPGLGCLICFLGISAWENIKACNC